MTSQKGGRKQAEVGGPAGRARRRLMEAAKEDVDEREA